MGYSDYIKYSLDPVGKPRFFGTYRGIVKNNSDPKKENKLRVSIPQITGEDYLDWAEPCFNQINGPIVLPKVGDTVWITFESGDTSYPVWTGINKAVPTTISNSYYGSFYNSAIQTATTANTVYTVELSTTVANRGIILDTPTAISFANPGTYLFTAELQFYHNNTNTIKAWLTKNNTENVVFSKKQYSVSTQVPYVLGSLKKILVLNANDFIEIKWVASNAGAQLKNDLPTVTPASAYTSPGSPSVSIEVFQI